MIFDKDILSMFGKIGRANLLVELFLEVDLAITFEVYNELLMAKEAGYDFVDEILKQRFKVNYLGSDLISECEHLKKELVRQEATLRIAAMPFLPFGMILLWHASPVMRRCEAHKTMWKSLKVIFG
ncbi:MAG: hypothetical protein ACT6FE_00345 [Methanosarcinaceae archaeon]